MNTVILFWNPSISSFSMNDYLDGMKNFEEFQLDWSVYEHASIFKGDRFYLVRVGEGNTGIVMNGIILGDPYIGEDWNGTDNPRFYVDLDIEWMVHPDKGPVLSTQQLFKLIPDFDWSGGHSGRVLNFDDSDECQKLRQLWLSNLNQHSADTDLFRHCPEPALDYVETGIAASARDKIKGIQLLDQFLGPDTNHLDKAVLRDLHFDRNNFSIDILIQPYQKDNLLLKFHFTDILDFKWDSPLFDTYLEPSCIYCQYSYLVTEFANVNITISSESLEVSLLEIDY